MQVLNNIMLFQKHDMEGTHYNWDGEEKNLLFIGQPSRRVFDRFNGEQVLFIINFHASQSDKFSLEDAKLIEKEIAYHLPADAKSEISVLNWIRNECLPDNKLLNKNL